jgi:DNA-directed RNA polymerase specialized sigma24 family protein
VQPDAIRVQPAARRADPAELVAQVASSRRELLLRVHSRRLRREDLEDCFGQAVLEMVIRARRGTPFVSVRHVANALEQRFVSRIHDRRRAVSGRSPMQAALEGALPLTSEGEEIAIRDRRAEPERVVLLRLELSRVAALLAQLSPDQRLVIASQVQQLDCEAFCAKHGWTLEKYRKVAQRGRARLRALVYEEEIAASVPRRSGRSEGTPGAPL